MFLIKFFKFEISHIAKKFRKDCFKYQRPNNSSSIMNIISKDTINNLGTVGTKRNKGEG